MHQMMFTAIGSILVIMGISAIEGNNTDAKAIVLSKKLFATDPSFNVGAVVVMVITAFLYAFFW